MYQTIGANQIYSVKFSENKSHKRITLQNRNLGVKENFTCDENVLTITAQKPSAILLFE